jgi:DNA-binding response OmpR family regulator
MTEVLIATDADAVFAEVEAALADERTTVLRVRAGQAVAGSVAESTPDLVVLDLQIGNMGGIATCIDLRHEAGAGRLPEVPVLMLLDRQADVFLAKRSGADGWVVKPLDAFSLRRAATAILEGEGDTTVEQALVGDVNPA